MSKFGPYYNAKSPISLDVFFIRVLLEDFKTGQAVKSMQKEFMHCKFMREILKLIKVTKHNEDIEAGDDSFKKQFTKAWIPRELT